MTVRLADQIILQLPRLRRFARALTGNQRSGDAYVQATLAALVDDPSLAIDTRDVTVSLFTTFCRVWQTIDLNKKPTVAATAWEANADLRLAAMMAEVRTVFLLRQLEGFSSADTARIIGKSVAKVDEFLRNAEEDIAQQLATRILIIEDEPLVSLDLSHLVSNLGHQVCAVARTHREAVGALTKERPGLVLADIRLADGSSGIDAVNEIMQTYSPPVIFITAHPDLLLTGERPEPTFLVSKPYASETVRAMISQVLFFQSATDREVA